MVTSDKALKGMKKVLRSFGPLESFDLERKSLLIIEDKYGIISAKLSYNVFYQNMRTRESFAISKGKGDGRWLINSHIIDREQRDRPPSP